MKVAVLENMPAAIDQFRAVLKPDQLDAFTTYPAFRDALDTGDEWDLAFLDFSLGREETHTGLSAFTDLHHRRPQTKLVAMTSLGDSSRNLYAVAVAHWFKAWGLMNKNQTDQGTLRRILDGHNPTPPGWQDLLRREAYLVDALFARPRWGPMWQVTGRAGGTSAGYRGLVPGVTPKIAREFTEGARDAAVNFAAAFTPWVHLSEQKQQVAMVTFFNENNEFLTAPDLLRALDAASPWTRAKI